MFTSIYIKNGASVHRSIDIDLLYKDLDQNEYKTIYIYS